MIFKYVKSVRTTTLCILRQQLIFINNKKINSYQTVMYILLSNTFGDHCAMYFHTNIRYMLCIGYCLQMYNEIAKKSSTLT